MRAIPNGHKIEIQGKGNAESETEIQACGGKARGRKADGGQERTEEER
jgi:hypothetical protein